MGFDVHLSLTVGNGNEPCPYPPGCTRNMPCSLMSCTTTLPMIHCAISDIAPNYNLHSKLLLSLPPSRTDTFCLQVHLLVVHSRLQENGSVSDPVQLQWQCRRRMRKCSCIFHSWGTQLWSLGLAYSEYESRLQSNSKTYLRAVEISE
ncbi:hypothetical protein M404DRAFT_994548 [Pisolithus tinctorius Marx 270]|uniref:Uncharacterized protein n=1 Tax=Pisolithus tinctorius Marx 270 TaxID=870435 RepID=A0A0C3PT60_PISTI|nr:hypothetical protein M404DRAFT_994548 [Pisolithus tinctorius Marx 270]